MDIDNRTCEYLDEYMDSSSQTDERASSSLSSPISKHTPLSRESSDEGYSSIANTSYTISSNLTSFPRFSGDPAVECTDSDTDFSLDDVFALEKELKDIDALQQPVGFDCFPARQMGNTLVEHSPRVSHRLEISPKTTLVLSDDIQRKKTRPVAITSTAMHGSTKPYFAECNFHESGVVDSSIFPETSDVRSCEANESGIAQATSVTYSLQSSFKLTHAQISHVSVAPSNEAFCNVEKEHQTTDTSRSPLEKQPLPPEGYKITRYPLDQIYDTCDQYEQNNDQTEGEVLQLRERLKRANTDTVHHMRQAEMWKVAAQHAFEAARKLRAQMELEKCRAERSESRIAQLTSHFRSKVAAKFQDIPAKSDEESAMFSSPEESTSSPASRDREKINTPLPRTTNLPKKRRRTTIALDDTTKDLASWLLPSGNITNTSYKNVSDVFSKRICSTKKFNILHAPQINSGVRLALRAKVRSKRAETLNTAHDIMQHIDALLEDLPVIPDGSSPLNAVAEKHTSGAVTYRPT